MSKEYGDKDASGFLRLPTLGLVVMRSNLGRGARTFPEAPGKLLTHPVRYLMSLSDRLVSKMSLHQFLPKKDDPGEPFKRTHRATHPESSFGILVGEFGIHYETKSNEKHRIWRGKPATRQGRPGKASARSPSSLALDSSVANLLLSPTSTSILVGNAVGT